MLIFGTVTNFESVCGKTGGKRAAFGTVKGK